VSARDFRQQVLGNGIEASWSDRRLTKLFAPGFCLALSVGIATGDLIRQPLTRYSCSAMQRRGWCGRSEADAKRRLFGPGIVSNAEAQSCFQPGLKYSVAWPLDHQVDGKKLSVCGTDLCRFSIRDRCGLLSKAVVISVSQGSQLLNHPMVFQVRGGGVRLCWTSE